MHVGHHIFARHLLLLLSIRNMAKRMGSRFRGRTGLRPLLLRIHGWLGISVGILLAVMGVTGATMAFQDEIEAALVGHVAPARGQTALAPDILIARALQQRAGAIARLEVERDVTIPARLSYAGKGDDTRQILLVDRTSGRLLGPVPGGAFFETVERVHRWMALPGNGLGIGRQVTGIAVLMLIYLALSGLYLRWPHRPWRWRSWLLLDIGKRRMGLYHELHRVIGGWLLVFYLMSGLTGLWWAFDWYRAGLQAMLGGDRVEHVKARGTISFERAWSGFYVATGGTPYAKVTMIAPRNGTAVQFRALPDGARHNRADDLVTIDGSTGKTMSIDRYATRRFGPALLAAMFEIHRGAFFGLPGRIVMMTTSLTLPLFAVTGALIYFGRRRRRHPTGSRAKRSEVTAAD